MPKLFLTQEIGSLPKPPWLVNYLRDEKVGSSDLEHLRRWSATSGFECLSETESVLSQPKGPESEKRIRELGSLFGLRFIESAGLDIVYDGEANRVEMYEHAIRNSEGFEFLGRVRSFDNRYYRKAACTTRVDFRTPYHLAEFTFVRGHAKRKLKVPVTGPYTLAEWSFNEFYQKNLAGKISDLSKLKFEAKREFVLDIARRIIKPNLRALVEAGADWIQFDEPALTTRPSEVPFFVEAFNECTAGLICKLSVHICYSNYRHLYPEILELKNCSQLALEFANRDGPHQEAYRELALLNEFGDNREVGLGVADVHVDAVEPAELIRDRILYAAELLGDPARIYANPDCGLRTRTWDVAYAKLRNVVKGAELARLAIS